MHFVHTPPIFRKEAAAWLVSDRNDEQTVLQFLEGQLFLTRDRMRVQFATFRHFPFFVLPFGTPSESTRCFPDYASSQRAVQRVLLLKGEREEEADRARP